MALDDIYKELHPQSDNNGESLKDVLLSMIANLILVLCFSIILSIVGYALLLNFEITRLESILNVLQIFSLLLLLFIAGRFLTTDNYLRRRSWANSASSNEEKRIQTAFAQRAGSAISSSWDLILFFTSVGILIISGYF